MREFVRQGSKKKYEKGFTIKESRRHKNTVLNDDLRRHKDVSPNNFRYTSPMPTLVTGQTNKMQLNRKDAPKKELGRNVTSVNKLVDKEINAAKMGACANQKNKVSNKQPNTYDNFQQPALKIADFSHCKSEISEEDLVAVKKLSYSSENYEDKSANLEENENLNLAQNIKRRTITTNIGIFK